MMGMPEEPLIPVELPHAGRMRWITRAAISDDGRRAFAIAEIDAEHPFVRAGALLPAALIELMAQTAAAASVLKSSQGGRRIRSGRLVAIREFHVTGALLVQGEKPSRIAIEAVHELAFGALSQVVFEVQSGEDRIATARMTFHVEFE